ncbi:hypothetical protein [Rubinisphaera margarita]|uniref:hypothetical protein n=1 Tax=Rubinisphaera margarita TaxID=2909586 RepID=UPI001EE7FCBF|nr:hypothetical protein [Rubinisphaera margarita]MCG6156882.1 hypothetical protein [Rubinisphaera margarita]
MPIQVTCESCFYDHTVKSEYAGKKFKCKGCGEPLVVPKAASKARSKPADDDDFLGALEAAASHQGQALPPAPAKRKKSTGKSSGRSDATPSAAMDDSNMKAIVGGIGTILLLVVAVGLKLVNRTDIVERIGSTDVEWTEFEVNDGALIVAMPELPTVVEKPLPEDFLKFENYAADSKNFGCAVSFATLNIPEVEDWQKPLFNIDSIRSELAAAVTQSPLSRILISNEFVDLHGIRTLHFVTEGIDESQGNRPVRSYAYFLLAGTSLYSLAFVEPTEDPQVEERTHFLETLYIADEVIADYDEWQGRQERALADGAPAAVETSPGESPAALSPSVE